MMLAGVAAVMPAQPLSAVSMITIPLMMLTSRARQTHAQGLPQQRPPGELNGLIEDRHRAARH